MKVIKSKKGFALLAVLAVAAVAAIGAYAYFTSTGSGAGSASVGSSSNLTITQTNTISGLTPGSAASAGRVPDRQPDRQRRSNPHESRSLRLRGASPASATAAARTLTSPPLLVGP